MEANSCVAGRYHGVLGAPGDIQVCISRLFHPLGAVPMVFLCTEISEDTHSYNHIYTDISSGKRNRKINMYTSLFIDNEWSEV